MPLTTDSQGREYTTGFRLRRDGRHMPDEAGRFLSMGWLDAKAALADGRRIDWSRGTDGQPAKIPPAINLVPEGAPA